MKTLLLPLAILIMFVQHRERNEIPNAYVYLFAADRIGEKVGGGICTDLVTACLDYSNDDWRKINGYDNDSVAILPLGKDTLYTQIYGRIVYQPVCGDVALFILKDSNHIGIYVERQGDCICILDQNSGKRKGVNSRVDYAWIMDSEIKKVIYFRPY